MADPWEQAAPAHRSAGDRQDDGAAKPLRYKQHIAHLSFSITALCGLFSGAGGPETLAVFIVLYTLLVWIAYHLETKAALGMRRDEPGLKEFRLMRLPLAIGGVGFCLDALASGASSQAPMLLFAFSAFGCALADGQRWADHKAGGGQ